MASSLRTRSAIIALILGAMSPARAADAFYLGSWKFTSAVVAPWADPAVRQPDTTERDSLLGKMVAIKPEAITGPSDFNCKHPKYALKEYPPDFLFQGAFGEMHDQDHSVDPAKLAAALGFKGTSFTTLETGCEFDWHFVDHATVEIGLNDWVYTLKKQ
ncbi:MAG TPA: hypothetical protein VGP48_02095 [Stellaceae bacterium]|jgi:hypothetical protein|nr:hypothetical protein [Stellaceae bacterium]